MDTRLRRIAALVAYVAGVLSDEALGVDYWPFVAKIALAFGVGLAVYSLVFGLTKRLTQK